MGQMAEESAASSAGVAVFAETERQHTRQARAASVMEASLRLSFMGAATSIGFDPSIARRLEGAMGRGDRERGIAVTFER